MRQRERAGGTVMDNDAVLRCYDTVARTYAARMADELSHKPFDRQQLDRLADATAGSGWIADAGCGPGQVAEYLRHRGAHALGIDLSEAMLREARRLNPEIPFQRHDLLRLGFADGAFAGIAAFYAIVHFDLDQLTQAIQEMARVLTPGGWALLAFHMQLTSDQTFQRSHHVNEFLGHQIPATFTFFHPHEVASRLESSSLVVHDV